MVSDPLPKALRVYYNLHTRVVHNRPALLGSPDTCEETRGGQRVPFVERGAAASGGLARQSQQWYGTALPLLCYTRWSLVTKRSGQLHVS